MCSPPREVTPDEAEALGKSLIPFIDSLISSGLTPVSALRLLRSALDSVATLYRQAPGPHEAVSVYHAPECPVAQPGFVANPDGLTSQCRCDFWQRLQAALDHSFCA